MTEAVAQVGDTQLGEDLLEPLLAAGAVESGRVSRIAGTLSATEWRRYTEASCCR